MMKTSGGIAFGAVIFGVLCGCGGNPPAKNTTPDQSSDAGATNKSAPDANWGVYDADAAAQAAATAAAEDASWMLLLDFDEIMPTPAVAKPESFAKIAGVTAFKKFRKTKKECTGKDDALIDVDGGYEGTFTVAGAKEVLYLVNVTPCDDKIAATHNLLVLQGGKVNLNQTIPENDIVTVKDLDLDGDQEILVASTTAPIKARLVDTEDGKFSQLYDFGELAQGKCDGGKPSGQTAIIKFKKTDSGIAYKVGSRAKTTCPGAASAAPVDPNVINITITTAGDMIIDGNAVTKDALDTTLKARSAANAQVTAVIAADKAVAHAKVVEMTDALKRAGVKKVALNVQ